MEFNILKMPLATCRQKKTAFKCPKSEELQQVRTPKYDPHVILDTSLLTHEVYIETLKNNLRKLKVPGSRRSSELQQITNSAKVAGKLDAPANVKITTEFLLEFLTIVIDNKDYRIAGAICYERDREHYKASTWRNHRYMYDDLRNHRAIPKVEEKVSPHVLLNVL